MPETHGYTDDTPYNRHMFVHMMSFFWDIEASQVTSSLGNSVFLAWTPLVLRKNRFLTSIQSFNFQCRWNAFWNNNLWFLFCHGSSAWRSAYISSRPWPMPCAATKPSQDCTSMATRLATRELRSGGWSDAERLGEVVWDSGWIRAEICGGSMEVMGSHRI